MENWSKWSNDIQKFKHFYLYGNLSSLELAEVANLVNLETFYTDVLNFYKKQTLIIILEYLR